MQVIIAVAAVACAGLVACTPRPAGSSTHDDSTSVTADSGGRNSSDSILAPPDRAVADAATVPAALTPPAPPPRVLSPLADTIAQYLVFAPTVQTWFLAAKRGKRLLVDIGRVDTDLRHDRHRAAAFAEAVSALSPVPSGAPLHLFHRWGQDTVTVSGFADWNGRIVATIKISPHLDSLVRATPAVFAAVQRIDTAQHADSAAAPDTSAAVVARRDSMRRDSVRRDSVHREFVRRDSVRRDSVHRDLVRRADSARHAGKPGGMPVGIPIDTTRVAASDSCSTDSVPAELLARAAQVRDSIEVWLRSQPPPPYDRLLATEKAQSSQVIGCFGGANKLAIAVDLRAGANEWVRERAVLLDTLGHVTTLRIDDYRFKGHDFIDVLDPNGAGIDGIVAKGVTEASGATVILALGPHNRAARWVSGFAWEAR